MKDAARHIAIFAKAPVPGLAKTRLAPALGAQGAAALAERLLNHAVAQAVAAGLGPVTVWATPDVTHPAFTRLQAQHRVRLAVQCDGDLGARMAAAFAAAFAAGAGRVAIIGTDCPGLRDAHLLQAFALLETNDLVLGPATDGGYYLLGLCQSRPELFRNKAWSTDSVLADTLADAGRLGLRVAFLPTLRDVDNGADLAVWRAENVT